MPTIRLSSVADLNLLSACLDGRKKFPTERLLHRGTKAYKQSQYVVRMSEEDYRAVITTNPRKRGRHGGRE